MLGLQSRPIRTVLMWQLAATVMIAALTGLLTGLHGAISGALGGAIGIAGGLVFTWMASRSRATTAGGVLYAALRAEGLKILVLFLLLALVLAIYENVVAVGLVGAFIVSTLIFGLGLFVRERDSNGR